MKTLIVSLILIGSQALAQVENTKPVADPSIISKISTTGYTWLLDSVKNPRHMCRLDNGSTKKCSQLNEADLKNELDATGNEKKAVDAALSECYTRGFSQCTIKHKSTILMLNQEEVIRGGSWGVNVQYFSGYISTAVIKGE